MTPPPTDDARWPTVRALFERALALPAAAREALLADAALAPDVVAEVRSLLAHANEDAAFLEPGGAAAGAGDRSGQTLGPWLISGRLGTGGMGEVWAARRGDGAYEGSVAIKILKRGMDSQALLARFAQEQRVLARLNHPHIARLFDAGVTSDHRPYFVMELIEGEPIDSALRTRTLDERLELFLQLSDAVAYAHRQLLVHRDLKPSNVLVDRHGQVKLLDFGIAKALEDDDAASTTQHGQRPFTPHYASPEQVRGEPVGTGTDIYSLGVLLYQLLTGLRPYGRDAATAQAAARSVLEDAPTRPSSLSPQLTDDPQWPATRQRLKGDLDNILLKALEKPLERRYASVDALAADIRAYRGGYPVSAQPARWGYLARKFVARNRLAVGLSALAAATLVAGLAATLWQAHAARLARDDARHRLAEVKQLTRDVVFRYGDAVTYLPGGLQIKEKMMLDAAQRLERFAALVQDDPELRGDVATAWARIAYVQGDETTASLGKPQDAVRHAERAIELGAQALASREHDAEFMLWMSRAHTARGHALRQADHKDEAMASFQRAVALLERGLQRQPGQRDLRTERATLRHATAQLLYQPGNNHLDRPAESMAQLQQARSELRELLAERHDVEVVYQLGTVVGAQHLVHFGRDELDAAIATGEEAVALRQRSAEEDPSSVVYQDGLMTEAHNLGFALVRAQRPQQALRYSSLAREAGLLLARQNGPASKWVRFTRLYAANHGRALAGSERHAEALQMFEEAEREWDKMLAEQPAKSSELRRSWVRVQRAKSLAATGRHAQARALLVAAAAHFERLREDPPLRHPALLNGGEAVLALSRLATGADAARWKLQAREAYLAAMTTKPLVGEYAAALAASQR